MLLDNYAAHLSVEAIDLALDHGIILLSFPPKYTHQMKSLDVTIFGPFKAMFTVKHDAWKKSNIGVLFDLHDVLLIVGQCFDVVLMPKIIKSY